ncbi:MAG: amidase [Agrococcus casei]|uniref:Amidase n=3 Tax=Agrococcus TaxID=46352 RepID=A0A1R4G296_9MICO|nr:amidase [Agrococcus casei]SJM62294.1 Amidase [Agrococcus casei LMG 22410]
MPDAATDTELTRATALELWQLIRDGDVTVSQVTEHFSDRIDRLDTHGAFVAKSPELASDRAARLDAASDRSAVLFGLPMADKDLHLRAGVPTTFGSRAFAGYVPEETDALTTQLDSAGVVSLGKTASPEFGFAGYTSSLAHGHTTIPGHPELGAGGSSGGAAAAVAAGLLPFAPGSDAGGSVRIPAAACGIVGLKPSRGRIPALGGQGSIGQLAVAGALGRSVADVALLTDGMIPREHGSTDYATVLRSPELDDGSLLASAIRGELADGRKRARIAVLTGETPWQDFVDTPISPEAKEALARAVEGLSAAGHEIEELEMPALPGYADEFVALWHFNAAALPVTDEQFELLEPLTQEFVRSGRAIGPRRVVQAVQAFAGYEQTVVRAFAPYDAVLTPTTALTPRPVGWHTDDPKVNFERQCQYTPHTSFVNVVGLPALSVPVLALDEGISMSVQLIGRPGDEAGILALGRQLERRIPWRERVEAAFAA